MAYTIRQTAEFATWLADLDDPSAKRRIAARLDRAAVGHLGDVKPVSGVSEMRIDYGPGYRLYFVIRGRTLIVLLCGGTKKTQDRDIKRANKMARDLEG